MINKSVVLISTCKSLQHKRNLAFQLKCDKKEIPTKPNPMCQKRDKMFLYHIKFMLEKFFDHI